VPPVGEDDHLTGDTDGLVIIEYADFECPFCAALSVILRDAPARRVFRHFPVRSSHPRAWPAACAAEAASLQGRFWEMHDLLFTDQGRLQDPHLWAYAETLGLDVERFDAERRGDRVRRRVRADFEGGVRAGVVITPTVFVDAERFSGRGAISAVRRILECSKRER
jgi:protein-disulfide isomerase